MEEFLRNYGPWLFFGILMFIMMRRGGCCGGHAGHAGHGRPGDRKEHDKHHHAEPRRNDTQGIKKSCH